MFFLKKMVRFSAQKHSKLFKMDLDFGDYLERKTHLNLIDGFSKTGLDDLEPF